jgi:hypothetical protein
MLYWTLMFLILAVVSGVFGFTGIASSAAGIAQILFYFFIVALIVSALSSALRGRMPRS